MNLFESVTIGKYSGTASPLERLDPRTKMAGVFMLTAAAVSVKNIYASGLLWAFLAAVVIAGRLPFLTLLKGLKPFAWMLAATFLLGIFYGGFRVSPGSVYLSAFITLRLVFIILAASVLTLTTSVAKLSRAIEWVLSPLRRINVPSHKIAFMVTMAIRFIPEICLEADRIACAQKFRGAGFSGRGLRPRVRGAVSFFFPLLAGSLRRSGEINEALVSRGYDPGLPRSSYYVLKWSPADTAALMLVLWAGILAVML